MITCYDGAKVLNAICGNESGVVSDLLKVCRGNESETIKSMVMSNCNEVLKKEFHIKNIFRYYVKTLSCCIRMAS